MLICTIPNNKYYYYYYYSRFLRLKDHYGENGLSLRVQGNHKRLPHGATLQAVSEDVKNFLTNYVEENTVLLPGRIPGFKNDDIKLLSSSDTKMFGASLKNHVKKLGGKGSVALNLSICGSSFTLTSSWQNLCLTSIF